MRPKNSRWETGLNNFCDDVKKHIGESPIIVELGSYMGESSVIFAKKFPNAKIYCVDSWEGGFDDKDSCSGVDYSHVESIFDQNCKEYKNIFKIKGLSTSVSINCDLVYIDACHKYECVKDDITHWSPLVSKVISGHDYCVDLEELNQHPHISGVKVAVDELLGKPDMLFEDWSWYKLIK